MGIEAVASFAACTKVEDRATIRSTLSRTKSAASSGSRAGWPSAPRNSIRMFCPSIQPRSRRPDRKACHRRASAGSDALFVKTPMRYTFPGCCASTASGARVRPKMRMTASPISRMLPGSLAEGHYAHQRPGLDEHRGAGQRALLDDLVRPLQQRLRDCEAERLGGLEVDDQLELRRLLDGQVAGLGTFEDPLHVVSRAPLQVKKVRAIHDKTAGLRVLPGS